MPLTQFHKCTHVMGPRLREDDGFTFTLEIRRYAGNHPHPASLVQSNVPLLPVNNTLDTAAVRNLALMSRGARS